MKTISLQDKAFNHCKTGYSSDFYTCKKMQWCRKFPYCSNITVFTDGCMHMSENKKYRNQINIAWTIETPDIYPTCYEYLRENWRNFDLILTYDRELLHDLPNTAFITYGDCWIQECDWNIYKKQKLCSIFCSEKKMTQQHLLRHECLKIDGIDKFGYMNHIDYKLSGLEEYKFSIVVENSKRNDWFTEKLLDCFATGTVPIYCGFSRVNRYFDLSGMIRFNTFEELKDIINDIKNFRQGALYEDFLYGIKNNFDLFRKYVVKEDLILEALENKGIL